MDASERLDKIYDKCVKYDESKMQTNMYNSRRFVDGFKDHLSMCGVRVDVMEQGSSFEGVKVGEPDEFDYILVFDCSNRVQAAEARNVGGRGFDRDKLAGYWKLRTADQDLQPYCSSDGALSPIEFKRKFQTYVNSFVNKVRNENALPGIRLARDASIANPALTVKVVTDSGTNISIDMSVCVRSGSRYYISKLLNTEGGDTFWLVMNSHEEKKIITRMSEKVKQSYRTVKYLLRDRVKNSYIIKTSFLHIYDKYDDRTLASKEALLNIILSDLKERYSNGTLTTYHNFSENLLARYSRETLENRANYFARLLRKSATSIIEELGGVFAESESARYNHDAYGESLSWDSPWNSYNKELGGVFAESESARYNQYAYGERSWDSPRNSNADSDSFRSSGRPYQYEEWERPSQLQNARESGCCWSCIQFCCKGCAFIAIIGLFLFYGFLLYVEEQERKRRQGYRF